MPHIVSTLANSQNITLWHKPAAPSNKTARAAVKEKSVLIKGTIGAGTKPGIIAPVGGVVTSVTDEQLEMLKAQPHFQDFVKKGHFKILAKEPSKPEKIAAEMPKDDGEVKGADGEKVGGSNQLSIENGDFEEGGRAAGIPGAEIAKPQEQE